MQQDRDLKADLEICNKATPGPWELSIDAYRNTCDCKGHGIYAEYLEVIPIEITRGLKPNEYSMGELQLLEDYKFIAEAREGWPHAIERAIKAEVELAKLRKVADAARRVMDAVMAQPQDVVERNIALAWLDAELAELDKEGER